MFFSVLEQFQVFLIGPTCHCNLAVTNLWVFLFIILVAFNFLLNSSSSKNSLLIIPTNWQAILSLVSENIKIKGSGKFLPLIVVLFVFIYLTPIYCEEPTQQNWVAILSHSSIKVLFSSILLLLGCNLIILPWVKIWGIATTPFFRNYIRNHPGFRELPRFNKWLIWLWCHPYPTVKMVIQYTYIRVFAYVFLGFTLASVGFLILTMPDSSWESCIQVFINFFQKSPTISSSRSMEIVKNVEAQAVPQQKPISPIPGYTALGLWILIIVINIWSS